MQDSRKCFRVKANSKEEKTTFKITDTCNGEKYPSHAPACRQLSCDFDLSMKNPMLIKYQHIPGDIHESTLPSRQLACFLSEAAQPPPSKIDRKIKPSIKVSLALSFSFSRSTSCSACNALGIRELVDPENLSDLFKLSRHSLNHPARINTKTWHTHLLVPLKS